MNPPPDRDDARLTALFRGVTPTLPDDGFSARVLAALPPPARSSIRRSRSPLCFGGALVGIVVALIGNSSTADASATWAALSAAFAPLSANLLEPSVLAGLLVGLGSALYALWPSLRRSNT